MDLVLGALAALALAVAAWLSVQLVRTRRALTRAQETALAVTETESEVAVATERNRIAREMHDVIAHTLSVVVAQADGGRLAGAQDSAVAIRSLETIADVSRAAIADLRGVLGQLRADDNGAPLGPQPALADIPALVATAREKGLQVSYVTTGTARPVPIGAGLALYRIAQESLTNVRKHAGPVATTMVQLQWSAAAVVLRIKDDGRGAAARGQAGHGIVGMRERVSAFGGTLTAGPVTGGGFAVCAQLPLGSGPQEAADSAPVNIPPTNTQETE